MKRVKSPFDLPYSFYGRKTECKNKQRLVEVREGRREERGTGEGEGGGRRHKF